MTTVILFRHGRTSANAGSVLAGDQPIDLDDAGQQQARAAGVRLAGLPLAAVVSSPLLRCWRSVELALPGAEIEPEPRLAECGYGTWTGRPLKELAKQPLWRVVQVHPSAAVFPEGESMAAMSARAIAAVRERDARVEAQHGSDAVWLACSHGDVIKAIVADAMGVHLDLFQRIVIDPGSLTVIRYTPLRPFLLRLNDTGSLEGLVPKRRRGRSRRRSSDAAVGGGASAS